MRVVQVIESFAYGSAKSVKQLAGIVKVESPVTVFYGERDGTELETELLDKDVEWKPLPGKGFFKHIVNILFLRRQFQVDDAVWHAHSTFAGFYVRIAALFNSRRNPKAQLFYSPRGYAFLRQDKSSKARMIFKFVEKKLAKVGVTVACGSAEYEIAKSLGGEVVKINNSLAVPESAQSYDHQGPILTIGRICFQKGFDIYLNIVKTMPNSNFVWVGSCEPEDEHFLKDLPSNLTVIPYLPHEKAIEFIGRSSMVLLPSRWEGLSRVLLETLVVGRPIITSSCSANRDCLVSSSEGYGNGYSCENISEYVEAISQVIASKDLAGNMAAHSREFALSDFDYKKIEADWLSLYFN
jgi:glycosyltransferase involved in cell wall biosynthesis